MPPAFSSTKQAAGFVLLLLVLLLSPVMVGRPFLPPREQIYSSISWGTGAYPYLHDQIFEETNDIDIAFMGTSKEWWGIDAPMVEAELSRTLGRKAVVRSLCWNWPGCDAFYFIMRDLLQHRKVRCIVFNDCRSGYEAHPAMPYLFRMADNAGELSGLPLRSKLSFYAASVVGMPRNLLDLLRANLPVVGGDTISYQGDVLYTNIENPFLREGSLAVRLQSGHPFVNYTPSAATPADGRVYSESTRDDFRFTGVPVIWPMQAAFYRKIGALAREHNVRLVCLHMPLSYERMAQIEESAYWPDILKSPVAIMGVAPARLFRGLSDDEVEKLFNNFEHMNVNGQEYFTSLMAPTLAQWYEHQTKP